MRFLLPLSAGFPTHDTLFLATKYWDTKVSGYCCTTCRKHREDTRHQHPLARANTAADTLQSSVGSLQIPDRLSLVELHPTENGPTATAFHCHELAEQPSDMSETTGLRRTTHLRRTKFPEIVETDE